MSAPLFILVKRGGTFWRPKAEGYTTSLLEAGLFDVAYAAEYQPGGGSDHSIAVPFDQSIRDRMQREVRGIEPEVLRALDLPQLVQALDIRPHSAAPDLFAALESLLASHDSGMGDRINAEIAARAALAKARGK